jgi:Protein of unknown function (DUF3306)
MNESFLARWSRRKDEARRNALDPPEADEAAAVAPDATPQDTDDQTKRTTEPALTPEEIAALPKIDALTADTDITVFLRRGVPEALKNAVLRRSWMLDPAIRDFVGHARDYAYDWNVPGGVPGSGALQPGDDVAAMVRRIFSGPAVASSGQSADQAARDRATAVRPGDMPAATVPDEAARQEEKSAAIDGEADTAKPQS